MPNVKHCDTCNTTIGKGTCERCKRIKSVGKCPYCNQYPFWFNNIPLTAYCYGTKEKPHKEWKKIVPKKYNPYL